MLDLLITDGLVIERSKGVGETSNIPVAGAIANAVFDAVCVRITDLPVMADKVLAGLKAQGSQGWNNLAPNFKTCPPGLSITRMENL